MNKGILAASVAAVLAAGAVGGSVYADKKVKDIYDAQGTFAQADKRIKLSNSEVEMGLGGGSGKWTATYTPDLCSPDLHFTLRGEDEIKRGLSGYTILSKIYFVPQDGQEIFIADSESSIGWGGGLKVKLTVPAGSHNLEQKLQLVWAQAEMDVAMSERDYQGQKRYFVDSYEAKIPEIHAQDGESFQFKLSNVRYRGDAPFQAGLIKSGKEEFDTESLMIQSPAFNVVLKQLSSSSHLDVGSDSLSGKSEFKLDSLQFAGRDAQFENGTLVNGQSYQNARLNTAVKGLDKAALQQFADLLVRQSQSCVQADELEQSARQIVIAAAQKGLNLASEGSQVELDGSKVTFDGSLNLPAGNYSEQQLSNQLLDLIQYQMKLVAEKVFLQKSGLLERNGHTVSDEELQQFAQQLPPPLKLDVQADKVTLSAAKP